MCVWITKLMFSCITTVSEKHFRFLPNKFSFGLRSRDVQMLLAWCCVWGWFADTPISILNWSITIGNVITWPEPQYKKIPHIMMLASPCFTVYCDLNSVFSARLTNCLQPLHSKRTIMLWSVHKMLHHFSLGHSMCSLSNCNLFSTCCFDNNRTLRGFLADSLASHRCLLIVAVLACNFRPSLISHGAHGGVFVTHLNSSFLFSSTSTWFWLPF